jgi:hypothetical protein
LEEAVILRDQDTVRALLFTAGTTSEIDRPDRGASHPAANGGFEWPELAASEADFRLREALVSGAAPPENDADQVSA